MDGEGGTVRLIDNKNHKCHLIIQGTICFFIRIIIYRFNAIARIIFNKYLLRSSIYAVINSIDIVEIGYINIRPAKNDKGWASIGPGIVVVLK